MRREGILVLGSTDLLFRRWMLGIHTSRRKGYIFYRWVNRHMYSEVVNVG